MCGLNGIFAYGREAPPVDLSELRRTRDRMAARGPDGAGEWLSADGRVGLGHRRLSIIDLRAVADQPMEHGNGRLRIVFNGEIYNYRDLRDELAARGAVFRTESDTEVLLQLWEREGPAMLPRLRGMFAFALWDEGKRGLFLARDPYGIKPLYVADDGRSLRFASQVKALVAGGHVDTTPEPAGHAGFFLWGNVPEPWTLHRGIRALPAGSSLWIDAAGERRAQRYFDLAAALRDGERAPREAAGNDLREALADTVRHHLVADVPVGVFLSAGLDSTTIAALAAESGDASLRTLTLGFEEFKGTENDETALATQVAALYGATHETRWVRGAEFAAEREDLLTAMDQPSIDGVNTYFVARAARQAGLKVALSGLGGDELFASYPSFRQVPKVVNALAPVRPLAAMGGALRAVAAPVVGAVTSPKYAGLLEYGTTVGGAYLLRRSLFMPWELDDVLPRDVAREGIERLETLTQLEASLGGLTNPRLQVSLLESAWYMRNQLLRDADWAGMAHSLEIRTPFVDAFLLRRLAPLLAAKAAPSKRAMADAPARKLPAAVLNRPKTGFVVPVREWLAGDRPQAERGLRGWARLVHDAFGGP
ncbi:MAG: asparagine synthase (glutamine-hydrolyzing) [Alphaproteobacteria bacterium]|nr:asparagine synthase (glutamine-hydrolyzing) [Alphaproteobacteria bacterium]